MIYDLIIVGAGPAGSTAAREAASAGASVLLLDRAEFPRDKPCGGGVNVRAAALLPFSLEAVTERVVHGIDVSLNLTGGFGRRYPQPLSFMTQRSRLDAYLAQKAVSAGATFRDSVIVRSVEDEGACAAVRAGSETFSGRVVVGADGANGVVSRTTGLAGGRRLAVALEGHYPLRPGVEDKWRDKLAMDLGVIPGGYGWLFPKADHLNLGVGGWQHFAPTLRSRLDSLAGYFGLAGVEPVYLRGHHLPVRTREAPLGSGRVLLAGDAAGLIDPLSGEGIYAAIYSGRLAAEQALRFVGGTATDLSGYARAINAFLGPELLASQQFQDVFHLMPGVYATLLRRSDRLWDTLCRLVRGEETYLGLRRRIGPLAGLVDLLSIAVRSPLLRHRAGLA
ncbi:MAG TPA: geranylgeranyl reductase family protein [Dehalococcoidia bacterium]|nr:geranylgeranyl reductase family protein [Dehalococcoidia bacterium]